MMLEDRAAFLKPSEVVRLAGALYFAMLGVGIALCVSAWLLPISESAPAVSAEILPSHMPQVTAKPREKGFLALAALLGAAGALFGALRRPVHYRRPAIIWGSLLAAVPLINLACQVALTRQHGGWWALVATLVLAGAGMAVGRTGRAGEIDYTLPDQRAGQFIKSTRVHGARAIHLAVSVTLVLVLLPWSRVEALAKIGISPELLGHIVSFIVGPATYSFGSGLLPGIDYYTQYSVGLPYLFSLVIGDTAGYTLTRYVGLMGASMFAFYLGTFYFLWWLYRSWRWSVAVTFTVLLLQFHTSHPFFDPSSYVLRYPLLVLMIWLFARWVASGGSNRLLATLSITLGASLFLNTETGLYQLIATTSLALLFSETWLSGTLRAGVVLLLTVFSFVAMCTTAFGAGVLQIEFFRSLIEPFIFFGGGYGAWNVDWKFSWHLLYNIIGPGSALATLGWAVGLHRTAGPSEKSGRLGALAMIACLAIMLSAKYWNMSIVALWHVNALGFLIILAWWARELLALHGRGEITLGSRTWKVRQLAIAILVAATACLLVFAGDPRNPTEYGLRAYLKYPSILNRALGLGKSACRELACAALHIAPEDLQLVRRLTKAGERVALVHWNDWAYLIEARRPSKFRFLPSQATFTRTHLRESLQDLRLVFVSRRSDGDFAIDSPELRDALIPLLNTEFRVIAKGRELTAFGRK